MKSPTILIFSAVLSLTGVLSAATEGDFDYTDKGTTITIDAYHGPGDGARAWFPSTINEKPVTAIGPRVLAGSSVGSISLPEHLTTIGTGAFRDMPNLSSVSLPVGVTAIPDDAFRGSGIDSVDFSNRITSIGSHAFADTPRLNISRIPASIKSVGDGAFARSGIHRIFMGGSTTLGTGVFSGSTLASAGFGENFKTIPAETFSNCPSLQVVNFGGVTSIGRRAFAGSGIGQFVVEGLVQDIGAQAFADCPNLYCIRLGGYLKSVGAGAFKNSPQLASAIFTSPAPAIGKNLFKGVPKGLSIYNASDLDGYTTGAWAKHKIARNSSKLLVRRTTSQKSEDSVTLRSREGVTSFGPIFLAVRGLPKPPKTEKQYQIFKIYNIGSRSAKNLSSTVSGSAAADFVQYGPVGATLKSGFSTGVTIGFLPKAAGRRAATLSIESTDATVPDFTIKLQGKGVNRIL